MVLLCVLLFSCGQSSQSPKEKIEDLVFESLDNPDRYTFLEIGEADTVNKLEYGKEQIELHIPFKYQLLNQDNSKTILDQVFIFDDEMNFKTLKVISVN